jgi:hypothetical protein
MDKAAIFVRRYSRSEFSNFSLVMQRFDCDTCLYMLEGCMVPGFHFKQCVNNQVLPSHRKTKHSDRRNFSRFSWTKTNGRPMSKPALPVFLLSKTCNKSFLLYAEFLEFVLLTLNISLIQSEAIIISDWFVWRLHKVLRKFYCRMMQCLPNMVAFSSKLDHNQDYFPFGVNTLAFLAATSWYLQ